MIYNTAELEAVSLIGACATINEDNPPTTAFQHPLVGDAPFPNACFSLATLENVRRLGVFKDKQSGLCAGILLEYNNDGHRSLGQCRVDLDPVEYYVKPAYICLHHQNSIRPRTNNLLQKTMVKCSSTREHDHCEDGWTCFAMRGELEFWFSSEETRLIKIVDK